MSHYTVTKLFVVIMRHEADSFTVYCSDHQPGRFWTLASLFGHNGETDLAKAAFKFKVSAVKCHRSKSGFGPVLLPPLVPPISLHNLKKVLKLTYEVFQLEDENWQVQGRNTYFCLLEVWQNTTIPLQSGDMREKV